MTLYGYRLVGNAKTAPADYIPSLIGIDHNQISPAGTDTYFEHIDLPVYAEDLTAISRSRWSTYDSALTTERDPILAVKAGTIGFYIPQSELQTQLEEAGDKMALTMLRSVKQVG